MSTKIVGLQTYESIKAKSFIKHTCVTGIKDTREGEVAILPNNTADVRFVRCDILVAAATKTGSIRIGSIQADSFTSKPYGTLATLSESYGSLQHMQLHL